MPYQVEDTIAAIASAPGGAVRGIVRLSGPETVSCVRESFQADPPVDLGRITRAVVVSGSLTLQGLRRRLPCDLYLWPTGRSYTGQVSAELHTIGSPPLLDAVLETLCGSGARLAEPGEFTLRAFLAGRLDLTQAEAVLGVVDAEDPQALDMALAQLAGGLAGPLKHLRSDLLDLLADLEAGLDFVDEDITFVSAQRADERLGGARGTMQEVLDQIGSRGTTCHEPRVVLRGWTNVGKSSLLNALCQNPAAIVSGLAGTTRDYVSRRFSWHGIHGLLIDTAGTDRASHRPPLATGASQHEPEHREGERGRDACQSDDVPRPRHHDPESAQQFARQQLRQADLELLCLDATRPLNRWERHALAQETAHPRAVVWTKIDAGDEQASLDLPQLRTSSHVGEGIQALRDYICERLHASGVPETTVVASTAQRCRLNLETAIRHIDHARRLLAENHGEELVALELRDALDQVGQVVGAVYTDDILDRIFQRFCIGK
ncbi:MAG: tRNA modification GTPase [Planctomycetota bacterium]